MSAIAFPVVLASLDRHRRAALEYVLNICVEVTCLSDINTMTRNNLAVTLINNMCVDTIVDEDILATMRRLNNQREFFVLLLKWWHEQLLRKKEDRALVASLRVSDADLEEVKKFADETTDLL